MEKESAAVLSSYGQKLMKAETRKKKTLYLVLYILLALTVIFSLHMGRYDISPENVLKGTVWGLCEGVLWLLRRLAGALGIPLVLQNPIPETWEQTSLLVLWQLRIPRIVGAFFIGGGLAVTGVSYQGVFRNPLVSESILGVSAGASLGAIFAAALEWGRGPASVMAFAGALLAVALTYLVSRVFKGNPTILLILAGTVVGSLFSAAFTWVQYTLAKDGNWQDGRILNLLFWLMGSLADVEASDLWELIAVIGVCYAVIRRMRWKLNLLSLGDEEARALGVDAGKTRLCLIVCATLIAAISAATCGMIGWIGLIVPQMARLIIGPDNRKLVPCSFLIGGVFLIACDIVSRALRLYEIPIGIVTTILGTPVFLALLVRTNRGWSES